MLPIQEFSAGDPVFAFQVASGSAPPLAAGIVRSEVHASVESALIIASMPRLMSSHWPASTGVPADFAWPFWRDGGELTWRVVMRTKGYFFSMGQNSTEPPLRAGLPSLGGCRLPA